MERPHQCRSLQCIIIGAGVSGILMAYKIRTHLRQYIDFKIYEKNTDLGGTWHENRYPGCACDVPSHCYQFPFAPNPEWSSFYASSQEIKDYLVRVTDHFGIRQHIHFNTKVTAAHWLESSSQWQISLDNDQIVLTDVLINAGGILNRPQIPSIKGWSSFRGPKLHTADWDPDVDLAGKHVTVIGAAASAVQVVPEIQKICNELTVHIRTPSWICPPVALDIPEATNYTYTGAEKAKFGANAADYMHERKRLERNFNSMFRAFFKTSPEQAELRQRLTARMKQLIPDVELQKQLIPDFEVGCRRISPGEKFLRTLQKANVHPTFDPIEEITSIGVVSDGVCRPSDVIVAATGFDTTFRPRFPLVGRNGINLQDLWAEEPISYMGTGVSGFPNYLIFLGPNTPISNGSLIGPLEATADYFIRLLREMLRQGVAAFEVRPKAQREFDEHTQAYMKDMVWTGTCRSWFKQGPDSKVTALWPGSSLHYMQTLAENRWEDYEWTYRHGRYAYWGRGMSWVEQPELDPLGTDENQALLNTTTMPRAGDDLTYYLNEVPPLPNAEGRRKRQAEENLRDSGIGSPVQKAAKVDGGDADAETAVTAASV